MSFRTFFGKSSHEKKRGAAARCQRRLAVEGLERRDLMACGVTLQAGGVLQISADPAGSKVEVIDYSPTPWTYSPAAMVMVTAGGPTEANHVVAAFPEIAITKIVFNGSNLADTFDDKRVNPYFPASCELFGNGGNDVLRGGMWSDLIRGGNGCDQLIGGSGNDRLYGDGDYDQLDGGDGDDQLRGGAFFDSMAGGKGNDSFVIGEDGYYDFVAGQQGADRFLVRIPLFLQFTDYSYNTVEDARIDFVDGAQIPVTFSNFSTPAWFAAGTWSTADLDLVDAAFAEVTRRTNNTKLLKTSVGGSMTFVRQGNQLSGPAGIGGWNSGGGNVTMVQSQFTQGQNAVMATVFHEIGHNWDNENPKWSGFMALSGWTQTLPANTPAGKYTQGANQNTTWFYLSTSTFARNYGRSDPNEDFATSVEAYFMNYCGRDTTQAANIPAKITFLNNFFNGLV